MRQLIKVLILALFLTTSAYAQDNKKDSATVGQDFKQAGKSAGKAVKKAAKTVGHKTAEVGAKGAAAVSDRALKNVKGPNGETVYVDKYDHKYYVNKTGKRVYL